ncbi:MAG: tetratricopeptide repeat protein, partial [Salinivenus sp.]
EALTHFEKGIEYAENDAYMYYGKGLALVNMDSTEAGLKTLQRAIEVGNQTGNTRVTGLASSRIRDEFLARASEALNAQNPTSSQIQTALDALDEMREYVDPNAQSLFYRGRALFEQGQYQTALETARQGLDMHQGSRSDAAKYYFIIAESQMNLGNEQSACQTFQQAAYGDYQARAQHYLKNDCQN